MEIEMKMHVSENCPDGKCETGKIDGLDAQIDTFDRSVSVSLRAWWPHCRGVSAHAPTREEAIAEAVRMARACGMVAE